MARLFSVMAQRSDEPCGARPASHLGKRQAKSCTAICRVVQAANSVWPLSRRSGKALVGTGFDGFSSDLPSAHRGVAHGLARSGELRVAIPSWSRPPAAQVVQPTQSANCVCVQPRDGLRGDMSAISSALVGAPHLVVDDLELPRAPAAKLQHGLGEVAAVQTRTPSWCEKPGEVQPLNAISFFTIELALAVHI